VTADFATSAAMANDILALEIDDHAPPPPTSPVPASAPATARTTGPHPVPDLDLPNGVAEASSASLMAPDFFTSSRPKSKKRVWKLSR
jgi:hypothetical protein